MNKFEQNGTKLEESSPLAARKSSANWVIAIVLIAVIAGAVVMMDIHNEKRVVYGQRTHQQ